MRLYAIIRGDLEMPPGKLAAQAGHAFLDAFGECQRLDPARAALYRTDGHGTKVVLRAEDRFDIEHLCKQAQASGLPCALIVDSGHVLPPHFDGSPIITALGIGPARREEIDHITGHLQLVK